ncbi:MAG: hypothetical protein EXS08_13655 [Planctomycetes bacterium]|nr:hypothetical protein [Planctomycetota bacterium]
MSCRNLPRLRRAVTHRRGGACFWTSTAGFGPLHIVWRIARGLPGLRTPRAQHRLERAFRIGKERDGFALVHYSIQHDHLHPMVEVKDRRKLSPRAPGARHPAGDVVELSLASPPRSGVRRTLLRQGPRKLEAGLEHRPLRPTTRASKARGECRSTLTRTPRALGSGRGATSTSAGRCAARR